MIETVGAATTLMGDTHAVDKVHRLSGSELEPHETEGSPSDSQDKTSSLHTA